MKILAWCDNPTWKREPTSPYIRQKVTGFGRAAHEILRALVEDGGHTVDVLGIGYNAWDYDRKLNPFTAYPASVAPAPGEMKSWLGLDRLFTFLVHGDYDALWVQMDPWQCRDFPKNMDKIRNRAGKRWLNVYAFPLDNICRSDYLPFISYCDQPVVWTDHALEELRKVSPDNADRTVKIGLGCDTQNFYPLPDAERAALKKQQFGNIGPLVICVATNQERKDYPMLLQCFARLRENHPDALLYLHTLQQSAEGLDLRAQIEQLNLQAAVRFPAPNDYMRADDATMNTMYNIADCYAMPSLGEGWGLPVTEAMSAGCPVVAGDNSSLTEIVGAARGYLVPSGEDIDHMIRTDDSGYRPRVNGELFITAMEFAIRAREERFDMLKAAREWCQAHTWESQNEKWVDLFARLGGQAKSKPVSS